MSTTVDVASACVLLWLFRAGIRIGSFARIRRLFAVLCGVAGRLPGAPGRSAGDVTAAIAVASRILPGRWRCLERAFAAQVLLSRHDIESAVTVGVKRTETGSFVAHSWVTPVREGGDPQSGDGFSGTETGASLVDGGGFVELGRLS